MYNKKIKLLEAIADNLFLLKLSYNACPSRVIGGFVSAIFRLCIEWMFFSVILIQKLMQFIENGTKFSKVASFLGISVGVMCLVELYQAYYERLISPAGNQKLYENLHKMMFEKATNVELECFEEPKFYNKYTKAASQIKGRAFAVLNIIPELLCVCMNVIFLTYKTVSIDVYVLVVLCLPIISTYVIGKSINLLQYDRYQNNVLFEREKDYVKRTVYLQDYAKEMRIYNIFNVMERKYDLAVKNIIKNVKKYGIKIVFMECLSNNMKYLFTVGLTAIYTCLRLMYWKNITASQAIVLISIIGTLAHFLTDFSNIFTKIQDNSLYIKNIRSFMEYKPKIAESQKGILPERHNCRVLMKNVSYTYKGQNKATLRNINLEIKPKQKIALVGHNGAGKTTLVKLLMRLYDVSEGEILLNDINIKSFDVRAYRNLYGSVFQDYKVISISVAENVIMEEIQEENRKKIIEALRNSGVYEKIMTLNKGIDTILTKEFDPEGAVLSGGEYQKIAIARVFAKDCDIVILDEPSSALDPIAEYKMYESMLKACRDRSVVFISHRLSSAVLADKIYVMEDGEIIESGSHKELLKIDGKYAQMFRMQAESYK